MLVLTAEFETIQESFQWVENHPLTIRYSLSQLALSLKRYLG